MAGNRSQFGPNVMTVQEATNQIAQKRVIRVSPTLAASAISGTAGDVLVNPTEIPNAVLRPGGAGLLVNAYVVDYTELIVMQQLIFQSLI